MPEFNDKLTNTKRKLKPTNASINMNINEPVLFSQNLCCTDQIWNREIQIKRTGSEQRRLSVVICAHRQYLRTKNDEKNENY